MTYLGGRKLGPGGSAREKAARSPHLPPLKAMTPGAQASSSPVAAARCPPSKNATVQERARLPLSGLPFSSLRPFVLGGQSRDVSWIRGVVQPDLELREVTTAPPRHDLSRRPEIGVRIVGTGEGSQISTKYTLLEVRCARAIMDEDAQEPPTKKCRVEPQDAKADTDPQVPSRESPPSGGPQAILPDPSPADCSGGGCGGGGDEEDDENAPVQVKYEVVEEVVAYESCSTMANDPDDEACDNPEPLVPLPADEGEPTDGSPAGSPELAELRAEWPVSPSQAVPVGAREPLPNMYTLQLMDQQHMDMTGVCPEHMPYDYRMMTLNQGPPSEDFQDQPPPYLLAHGGGYSVRLLQDESQGDKLKGARVLVDGEVRNEVYPTLDVGQRTAAYAPHTVISSPGQQASY
ncbi:hypothetical protein HPB47_026605, partial [Ixodes persulcatus]